MRAGEERGQGSVEYVGVLVLVAAIVGAFFVTRINDEVGGAAERAVCRIVNLGDGEDCGDESSGSDDGDGSDGSDPSDGSDDPDDDDGEDDDGDGEDEDDGDDDPPDDGDDDLEDEAEDMADELAEEIENTPGFFELNSFGECGSVSGTLPGVGGTHQGCLVYDGDEVAILYTAGVGGAISSPAVDGMVGPIVSNAETIDQLTGPSVCVGGGFVAPPPVFVGGGGDICFGLNEDRNGFTGIWTLHAGVAAGVPGGEGHIYYTETASLAELDVPDLPSIEEIEDWVEDSGMELVEGVETVERALGEVAGEVQDRTEDVIDTGCGVADVPGICD